MTCMKKVVQSHAKSIRPFYMTLLLASVHFKNFERSNHLLRCTRIKQKDWSSVYHNVPKFSDRQFGANSADPDQTAPRGSLIRVYTVCDFLCIFWMHYCQEKSSCSTFRVITANFRVSETLGVLRYKVTPYSKKRNCCNHPKI